MTDCVEAERLTADPSVALDRLIVGRHSCRGFLSREVEKRVIEAMFASAQGAASWCNSQPWQVTVVSGTALERLRMALLAAAEGDGERGSDFSFPAEYRGVYGDRRRECGFQLYSSVGIARGDRAGYARQAAENYRFFCAPHVAVLTSDANLGAYGAIDVGGYLQVLLLAMQARGIASIPQAAPANYSRRVKEIAGISEDRLLVCTVAFGYEDADHPANSFRTSRASLSDVIAWVDQ